MSDITEKPKNLLCTGGVKLRPLLAVQDPTAEITVYKALKCSFEHENGSLDFYLNKLEKEFQEAHRLASVDDLFKGPKALSKQKKSAKYND